VLQGDVARQLGAPLPLAVAAGLFLGKQIGIFGAIWACVKTGLAAMPRGATWPQLYGLTLLCGIGFTMSLFIGGLAFPGTPHLGEEAKAGILAGSLLSALVGLAVLRFAPLHRNHAAIAAAEAAEIAADGDVAS
jgi:NhaA family Na+:H+ antiporter